MITKEEKQEIINLAVEKTLLMIPEVVGNMMTNHVTMTEINKKFYEKFPEFRRRKDIVVSVIEMIEGQDPTVNYEKILEKSVPEIKRQIALTESVNTTKAPTTYNRDFSNHGDI